MTQGHSQNMIYINIGAGIAGGTVSNGRLINGSHFYAGEIGHIASGIAFHKPFVGGRPDCVEPMASYMRLNLSVRLLATPCPDHPMF